MLALQAYEDSLCACGEPRRVAWHAELEGWWEADSYVCHVCTARNDGKQVSYSTAHLSEDYHQRHSLEDLPPFRLGETTVPPEITGRTQHRDD